MLHVVIDEENAGAATLCQSYICLQQHIQAHGAEDGAAWNAQRVEAHHSRLPVGGSMIAVPRSQGSARRTFSVTTFAQRLSLP